MLPDQGLSWRAIAFREIVFGRLLDDSRSLGLKYLT